MKRSSRIKPISYLKAHVAEIVRSLGDRREPLIITQNGEAKGACGTRPGRDLRLH